MKRILDCFSIKSRIQKEDLLSAIRQAQGRTILSESFLSKTSMLGDISNAELARAFGADMVLLNDVAMVHFSVPGIKGKLNSIEDLKQYVACPVGIDLYVINGENQDWPPKALEANVDNLTKAVQMGFDFVNIVADPVDGVSNDELVSCIKALPESLKDQIAIFSGRMNMGGISNRCSEVLNLEFVESLAEVGVDVILLPMAGTAQGLTESLAFTLVEHARSLGRLTMGCIGSSQEGSNTSSLEQIALSSRRIGFDIHHLGDAGYVSGMATPENIMQYSIAIKGKRHTYRKMSRRYE